MVVRNAAEFSTRSPKMSQGGVAGETNVVACGRFVRRSDASGLWVLIDYVDGRGDSSDDVALLARATNDDGSVPASVFRVVEECFAVDLVALRDVADGGGGDIARDFDFLSFRCGAGSGVEEIIFSKLATGAYGVYRIQEGHEPERLFEADWGEIRFLVDALRETSATEWHAYRPADEWAICDWYWSFDLIAAGVHLESSGSFDMPPAFERLEHIIRLLADSDRRRRKRWGKCEAFGR